MYCSGFSITYTRVGKTSPIKHDLDCPNVTSAKNDLSCSSSSLHTHLNMLREIKPKTARSARAVAKRGPQVNENPKTVLFLKSSSSSSLLNSLSADLFALKKPLAIRFSKKNTIHPFEDPSSLEFFSEKNDASLLCFASHSKKRPHCLTFARCFGNKILDMLECTVVQSTARTMAQFGGSKSRVGTKPLLSFSGLPFDSLASGEKGYNRFELAKSMFLDFFRGEEAAEVDVEGLQTMISFVAVSDVSSSSQESGTIHMRVWHIISKRSGQRLPRVEVEETGPRIDFRLGRYRAADESMRKQSFRKVHVSGAKLKKNREMDAIGDKTGRIHLGRQNFDDIQTRKLKGLKRGIDDIGVNEDEFLGEQSDGYDEDSGASDHVGLSSFHSPDNHEVLMNTPISPGSILKRPRLDEGI